MAPGQEDDTSSSHLNWRPSSVSPQNCHYPHLLCTSGHYTECVAVSLPCCTRGLCALFISVPSDTCRELGLVHTHYSTFEHRLPESLALQFIHRVTPS